MSQRTGIPANMVAKAKKMIIDGVSVEHIAQHYRCPVSTIQSFADVINNAKSKPKLASVPAADHDTKSEPETIDTAPEREEDGLTPPPA